jgi:hypothetical protein
LFNPAKCTIKSLLAWTPAVSNMGVEELWWDHTKDPYQSPSNKLLPVLEHLSKIAPGFSIICLSTVFYLASIPNASGQ